MSSPPYQKFFWGSYHKHTAHLSHARDHGAYLLLIGALWNNDGRLPADDETLAAYARLSPEEWLEVKPKLMRLFKVVRGKLTQPRVVEDLEKYKDTSGKRKAAGKAGGLASGGKRSRNQEAFASDLPTKSEPEPEPKKKKAPPKKAQPPAALELDGGPDKTPARMAFELYNDVAGRVGGSLAADLTESRRSKLNSRMNGRGFVVWQEAMERVERSLFLCGEARSRRGEEPFKLNLDMLLRPDNFQRLMEGFYGEDRDPSDTPEGADPKTWSSERWRRVMAIWDHSSEWPDNAGPEPGQPGYLGPSTGDDYGRQ